MKGKENWVTIRLWSKLQAADIMEQKVCCFEKDVNCDVLLCAIVQGKYGSIPIVNGEKKLIGIVSEYDLLEGILSGIDLTCLQAGEMMKHPHSVSSDCPAREVGRFLQENGLIRVPVVNQENKLVGIIARRDLLTGFREGKLGLLK